MTEVIGKVYEHLQEYFGAVANYVTPNQLLEPGKMQSRRDDANSAMRDFRVYFRPRRIYLPREVTEKIDALDNALFASADQFATSVEDHAADPTNLTKNCMEAFAKLRKDAKTVLDELYDQFQALLGVTYPGSHDGAVAAATDG